MTLTVGPALCLLQAVVGAGGLRSTPCTRETLAGGGVEKVEFTVLGLEPGDHTLTFTLETQHGKKDILEKKLRVVVCTGGSQTSNFQTGLSQNLPHICALVCCFSLKARNRSCWLEARWTHRDSTVRGLMPDQLRVPFQQ